MRLTRYTVRGFDCDESGNHRQAFEYIAHAINVEYAKNQAENHRRLMNRTSVNITKVVAG